MNFMDVLLVFDGLLFEFLPFFSPKKFKLVSLFLSDLLQFFGCICSLL